jgi:histone deacetylase 11
MKLVYASSYNIGLFGIERLHPFDSRKYGRAWQAIGQELQHLRDEALVKVQRPASIADLAAVHDQAYLEQLQIPQILAKALELPIIERVPAAAVRWAILRPMRWAVAGSVIAAREALTAGLAVNLSGGYHHAKPDHGEGFCVFNDIAYLVHCLRFDGQMEPDDRVAYIDLDAHQGNGVCHHFRTDRRVFVYDAFNRDIYPSYDLVARERINCPVPLPTGCTGADYLRLLKSSLPGFLDKVPQNGRVGLAIYNAGTDVFEGDSLGGMKLSAADVLERDLYVIGELRTRNIPAVMLLSGGYSPESHRLVANTVVELLKRYGAREAWTHQRHTLASFPTRPS